MMSKEEVFRNYWDGLLPYEAAIQYLGNQYGMNAVDADDFLHPIKKEAC